MEETVFPYGRVQIRCRNGRAVARLLTLVGAWRRPGRRSAVEITEKIRYTMHLTPKEIDKLLLLSLGAIAERRLKKGLKLNHPEAVAYITATALEGAREGKTVEEVMKEAASVLKRKDVMEGVADMISLLQVEAVFTDGSRLVSIHQPIR